jgi:AcrR family transcriptional regulator
MEQRLQALEDADKETPVQEPTAARLLGTAAALFRAKGYASSTTRELAALLGIQKASLYHHIDKKEDLLYALCVDSLQRIHGAVEEAIAPESLPLERLRCLIRAHLQAALADQDKHATMLIELRELSGKRYEEVLGLRDAYEALVRETIAEAQRSGSIRSDMPPKYLTLALLNLLNWSIFWFRTGGELNPEELADLLAAVFLEGAVVSDTAVRGQRVLQGHRE